MGMALNFGPILIGEYTSPKNRGAFLMFVSVLTATEVLVTHAIGSYYTWQFNALVNMVIAFFNLAIVIYSPESPAWLASKSRYDSCRKAFRWLRGSGEESELEELIKSNMITNDSKVQSQKDSKEGLMTYLKHNVNKKEFYMPIFIMAHVYGIGQWAGINVLSTYTKDVFENIIGKDNDIAVHIIAIDTQRILSNAAAIFLIRRVRRRTMLMSITSLGILTMLATAAYTYSKTEGYITFEHPILGVFLVHIHMFTVATCTISLPYIIAGEIFPLKYKGVAGGISILFFSLHFTAVVKFTPYLFASLGIYGAYCVYSIVVAYCLLVAWIFLPETKDRTLQDIENEFRGKDLDITEYDPSLTNQLVTR
jgi:facilitated trehalose transporter